MVPSAGQRKGGPINNKALTRRALLFMGRLAVTYFRAGNPHYHRRRVVSPSCSGWEGVGPTRYGRQANCWEVDAIRLRPAFVGRVALTIWKKYSWVGSATQGTAAFEPGHPGSRFGSYASPLTLGTPHATQGYRIKSHGQLVSVSLTCYHASTPDLSTSWSRTTL